GELRVVVTSSCSCTCNALPSRPPGARDYERGLGRRAKYRHRASGESVARAKGITQVAFGQAGAIDVAGPRLSNRIEPVCKRWFLLKPEAGGPIRTWQTCEPMDALLMNCGL